MTEKEQLRTWAELSETLSLIPLNGKVPIEKGWERWCLNRRPFQIQDFRGRNAGIACGPASNRLVLDVDCPAGFDISCMLKGWILPKTYTVCTRRAKRHHYFSYPGGNGQSYGNKSFKKWGFDLRGEGGQVVAAGSIHPDTGEPYTVMDPSPVVPPPQWLLDLYEKPKPQTSQVGGIPTPWAGDIDALPIKPETRDLIRNGVPVGQRSEAIMTVVNSLVWSNLSDGDIFSIFDAYPIGEKYQEKGQARERWLESQIRKGREYITETASNAAKVVPFQTKKAKKSPEKAKSFNLTDLGNSERLTAQHGQDVKYCHAWGKWLVWDGRRWACDRTEEIRRKARETVRNIYKEASRCLDEDERKSIAKWAMRSESNQKIYAMLSLAESEEGVPVISEKLDADPMLFNCLNGTIDLKTGQLLPHNRGHLITKMAAIECPKNQTHPAWDTFLERIMAGNKDLISFLQRAVGYTLSGDTREQCLFFLYGLGSNGKSTFLEILRAVLGDYAQQTDFSTFLLQKYETIRNDLARLKGARMVAAVEADSGKRLAEVLVKQVTGQDTITARHLFKEYFEFVPQFKIWWGANHKPEIWGTDLAIWRRIRLVPFNVTIPEAEQDKDLPNKLREEFPGILAWAVQGCLQWQQEGLQPPAEVRAATEGYRQEMDLLGPFIEDRCLINERLKVRAKDIYQEYCTWCEDNGEKPATQRTFGTRLRERGLTRGRGTGSVHYWHGIGIVTQVTHSDVKSDYLRETPSSEAINREKGNKGSLGSLDVPEHLVGTHPDGSPKIDPEVAKEVYGED